MPKNIQELIDLHARLLERVNKSRTKTYHFRVEVAGDLKQIQEILRNHPFTIKSTAINTIAVGGRGSGEGVLNSLKLIASKLEGYKVVSAKIVSEKGDYCLFILDDGRAVIDID